MARRTITGARQVLTDMAPQLNPEMWRRLEEEVVAAERVAVGRANDFISRQYDSAATVSNDTVAAVLVGGRPVFRRGEPTDLVGTIRTGSFLRAGRKVAPAPAEQALTVGG